MSATSDYVNKRFHDALQRVRVCQHRFRLAAEPKPNYSFEAVAHAVDALEAARIDLVEVVLKYGDNMRYVHGLEEVPLENDDD